MYVEFIFVACSVANQINVMNVPQSIVKLNDYKTKQELTCLPAHTQSTFTVLLSTLLSLNVWSSQGHFRDYVWSKCGSDLSSIVFKLSTSHTQQDVVILLISDFLFPDCLCLSAFFLCLSSTFSLINLTHADHCTFFVACCGAVCFGVQNECRRVAVHSFHFVQSACYVQLFDVKINIDKDPASLQTSLFPACIVLPVKLYLA